MKDIDCSSLIEELETKQNRQKEKKAFTSFQALIFWSFYKDLLYNGFLVLTVKVSVVVLQPFIFGKILDCFTQDQSGVASNEEEGLYYILALIGLLLFQAIFFHQVLYAMLVLGLKVRAVCSGTVYSKAMNATKQELEEFTSIGQIMNILTNSATHVEYGFMYIHYLFLLPFEIVAAAICLYFSVGYSGLAGLGVFMLIFLVELYISLAFKKLKVQLGQATESRLQLITEFICGIQTIKMFAWDSQFATLITEARNLEIKRQKRMAFLKTFHLCFKIFLPMWAMCVTIVTANFLGNDVTPKFVFKAYIYYNILTISLCFQFPRGLTNLMELKHALNEIQSFVQNAVKPKCFPVTKNSSTPNVCLKSISAKWSLELPNHCLTDVHFSAAKGLTAIIGCSGSGKSALLYTILRETCILEGTVSVEGAISYASQDPWIFPASVRQNILFGEEFNEERYSKVIKICGLKHDLAIFSDGDRSLVGERGVLLSGGQKARINLARAVYKDADIYILDDPLSAIDANVGKQIFEQCILDFLSEKCVLLVTHQVHILQKVQQIYILDNGRIKNKKCFTSKTISQKYISNLARNQVKLDDNENVVAKTCKTAQENDKQNYSHSIIKSIYRYFTYGANCFTCLVLLAGFLTVQLTINTSDYFLTFWVDLHQEPTSVTDSQFIKQTKEFLTFDNFFNIYVALAFICAIFTACRTILFVHISVKSSQVLHNLTLANIVRAPMKFFNMETSGKVLNKFSKDLGMIDQILSEYLFVFLQSGLHTIGPLILISILNYVYAIPSLVFLLVLFLMTGSLIGKVTELTNRGLRSRGSIYTYAMVSIQGLVTVNALNAGPRLIKEFEQIQSKNCVANFIKHEAFFIMGFVTDCLCILFLALVLFSIYFLQIETEVANMGLIIFQIISLVGTVQASTKVLLELYTCSMSLTSIYEYTQIPSEDDNPVLEIAKPWPSKGHIKFDEICLQYTSSGHPVLKNITVEINPSEKIGIIGRTGSGKSSLISTLFRLYDFSGTMIIDGVDTKKIALQDLRANLTIIPQNPILFSGSLRRNLDPFDESTDDQIWKVLEEVKLTSFISNLPSQLDAYVRESGNNFSNGERQLLCLARAILRNSKILVLDEVTSNIDLETDQLIQKTIRSKFKSSTLLTIAHRLYTVIDSDKILVLSDGKIVEFDHPYHLLNNPNGILYNQLLQNGKEIMEELRDLTKAHYMKTLQLKE